MKHVKIGLNTKSNVLRMLTSQHRMRFSLERKCLLVKLNRSNISFVQKLHDVVKKRSVLQYPLLSWCAPEFQ